MSSTPVKKIKPAQQIRTLQPTYRLEPKKPFNMEKVQNIIKQTLEAELSDVEYNEKSIPEITLNLSGIILKAVKEEQYDRYRLVAVVSVGQQRQQSVHLAHAFLWDAERDAFAAHTFENSHIFAHATVYGVYLD